MSSYRYMFNGETHEVSPEEVMAIEMSGRCSLAEYIVQPDAKRREYFYGLKQTSNDMRWRPGAVPFGVRPAHLEVKPADSMLWNEEELIVLRTVYPAYGIDEVARRLNRTRRSVREKAFDLDLSTSDGMHAWPEATVKNLVKFMNAGLNYNEISTMMGKSYNAVRARVYKMRQEGTL